MKDRVWVYGDGVLGDIVALNNDCGNVEIATPSVLSSGSLNFDKLNGAGNTIYAIVYGTPKFQSDLLAYPAFGPTAKIYWSINIPDLTNVANSFVRLGTSASNYVEWRFADTSHTAARFTLANANLAEGYPTGTGNLRTVTYMQIGVTFDAETNALANILVDGVWIEES